MTTAEDVARHLIRLAGTETEDPAPEPMTAMRLQKLLYYCQGWHLAWHGRPLFADRIEAWKYGPVVPPLYDKLKPNGGGPLPDQGEPRSLSDDERAAVEQVWAHYKQFSACGLKDKTHEEPPWKRHYKPDGNARCSNVIPVVELAEFFGEEYRKETGHEPGDWSDPDPTAGISLEKLRQELGC